MKSFSRVALIVSLLVVPQFAWAQNNHAAAIEGLKTYRFGGSDAALNEVTQWVREVRDNANARPEAAKSLAGVLTSDAPFDAKQFACRQLALIAGETEIPALATLLKDDNLAHYATMALLQIPSPNVEENLRGALPNSSGKAQLEIIDALGQRRDKNALAPLLTLFAGEGAPAVAAALALGNIGDARCLPPLMTVYQAADGAKKTATATALLIAVEHLRDSGAGVLTPVYELLKNDSSPTISAGALRGLVLANNDKSLPLLLEALAKDDTPQQRTAAALSRDVLKGEQGARATQLLANSLPKLSPMGQALLLNALGERGDAGAAPAVAALLKSDDATVRLAAADAIGALGDATTVPLLLNLAAGNVKEARDAARASLVRLKGQAIDDKLLASLDKATAPQKAEIIGALQARRVQKAVLPILRQVTNQPEDVRAAALTALRDIGESSLLNPLLTLLVTTRENRAPIMDTIVEIARRGDEVERSAAILKEIDRSPGAIRDLINLLGRVGGHGALETLRRYTKSADGEIVLTTVRALSAWPTDEPMPDLLNVVQKSPYEKARLLAARGYARLIGLSKTRPAAETLKLLQQAAALDKSPEATRAIIAGVSKLKTLDALNYASGFVKDDAVRGEAELAVVEIARGTLGVWRDPSRAAAEPIAKTSANANARQGAQAILDLSDKLGDFVTAWEVSPAYEQAGANVAQLFDIAFAPEDPKTETKNAVVWNIMPIATSAEQPWLLDLLALYGGENKVAYLRTSVWADKERDLVLESGSDDGTKAWWNGQVILSQNVQRAVAPGQEKTKVTTKAGWNELMLKITQNNQGWGTVARFTNPDGSPATGLRFSIPSAF